jgi:hypothetical protein
MLARPNVVLFYPFLAGVGLELIKEGILRSDCDVGCAGAR